MADQRWVDVSVAGSYFESLSDPRHTRNRRHLLVDVIVIAVCGIISNCDGPMKQIDLPNAIVTIDVNFREDAQQTSGRTLVNNLSWLRRFAVTLLKKHPRKDSIFGKMQIAGCNTDFLEEVLLG